MAELEAYFDEEYGWRLRPIINYKEKVMGTMEYLEELEDERLRGDEL